MNFNRNAVASVLQFDTHKSDATPLGLGIRTLLFTQGSRSGNPGLEGVTPSGLDQRNQEYIMVSHVNPARLLL